MFYSMALLSFFAVFEYKESMKNFITFIFLLNGTLFAHLDKDVLEKFKSQLENKSKYSRFINIGSNI